MVLSDETTSGSTGFPMAGRDCAQVVRGRQEEECFFSQDLCGGKERERSGSGEPKFKSGGGMSGVGRNASKGGEQRTGEQEMSPDSGEGVAGGSSAGGGVAL